MACSKRPLSESACHLDLVGSFRSNMREADDDCLRDAFIAVDTLDALKNSGDLISPLAAGVIEKGKISPLNDLVAQAKKAPRASKTVFKSVGVAHADLAAAEQIYERRRRSM